MKRRILHAMAALLVLAVPAGARPLHTITEVGHEIIASMLTLPSSTNGTLSIQGCTACQRQSMTLGADARFYIGKYEVTYGELKSVVAAYPKSPVLVVTPVGKNVVTRIRLSAAIAASAR